MVILKKTAIRAEREAGEAAAPPLGNTQAAFYIFIKKINYGCMEDLQEFQASDLMFMCLISNVEI